MNAGIHWEKIKYFYISGVDLLKMISLTNQVTTVTHNIFLLKCE